MQRLDVSHLTCLRGSRLVFEDLEFSVEAGDGLLLTGANGSGKSSLLRLLAGLLEPLAGRIVADGRDITDDPDARCGEAAYVGHLDSVKPTLTVSEALGFWAAILGVEAPVEDAVKRAMVALNLTHLKDVPGQILSSGQRRRLSLSRLFLAETPLWLLDEPTVGLDTAAVAAVEGLVANHRAQGGIVILSTHVEFQLPGGQTFDLGDFALGQARAPDREADA